MSAHVPKSNKLGQKTRANYHPFIRGSEKWTSVFTHTPATTNQARKPPSGTVTSVLVSDTGSLSIENSCFLGPVWFSQDDMAYNSLMVWVTLCRSKWNINALFPKKSKRLQNKLVGQALVYSRIMQWGEKLHAERMCSCTLLEAWEAKKVRVHSYM